MYCPSCRSEYIEGVKMCKECDVMLVEDMPPEPRLEYQEQVGVFSSTSPSLVAMAQSVLESAGIESYIRDASLANLLDMSIVELQVARENEEDARTLLEELKEIDESEVEGEESDESEEEESEEEESEEEEEEEEEEESEDEEFDEEEEDEEVVEEEVVVEEIVVEKIVVEEVAVSEGEAEAKPEPEAEEKKE